MTRGRVGGLGTPSSSVERGSFFPPELASSESMNKEEDKSDYENDDGIGNENSLQAMPMKGGKNRYANISPSPTDDNDAIKNALKNPFLERKGNKEKKGDDVIDQNRKNAPNFGKISKSILSTQFSTEGVDGCLGSLGDFDLHQFHDKVLHADSVRQSEDLNDLQSDSTSLELYGIDNNKIVDNNMKNINSSNVENNEITDNNDDNDNETQSTNGSGSDIKKYEIGRNRKGSTGSVRSSAERDDIIDLRNKRIDVVGT